MRIAAILMAAALGYFLGSINFSIIIFNMKGKDIRTIGSHNAGLTNAYRCGGALYAVLTLLGDLSKGIVAIGLSYLFSHFMKVGLTPNNDVHYIGYIAGFFAIIGHIFPIYYNFHGGKGVLVCVSSFIILDPKVFFAFIIVFSIMLSLSKYVSLSSILAIAYIPIAILLMSLTVNNISLRRSLMYMLLSLPMVTVITWMHRSNIHRLMEGTESKFTFKKKTNN